MRSTDDRARARPPYRTTARNRARRRAHTLAFGIAVWAVVAANAGVITWLWLRGGGVSAVHTWGDLATSTGRLTGMLGAYLALIEILLLARLPWLERLVGFDKLTNWHRWNGHLCLWLILAHVVFQVWAYGMTDFPPKSFFDEFWWLLTGNFLPGMITATVGTVLVMIVAWSSFVIVRRRLPYELWYAVHITAYAGIALAWFHQLPTGYEFVKHHRATNYWYSLYIATLVLIAWRLAVPLINALPASAARLGGRARGPGVVSLTDRRPAARQDARSVGTVLHLALPHQGLLVGTAPVLALGRARRPIVSHHGQGARRPLRTDGPHQPGHARRRRGPVRGLHGRLALPGEGAARRGRDRDHPDQGADRGDGRGHRRALPCRLGRGSRLPRGARAARAERGITLHNVVGDHPAPGGERLLSAAHLRELAPDVAEREVFLCGPPAMTHVIEKSVRGAGVPRAFVHVERFAL